MSIIIKIVAKHLVNKIKLGQKNMIIIGDYQTNFAYKISWPILSFIIGVLSPYIFIGRNSLIILHNSLMSPIIAGDVTYNFWLGCRLLIISIYRPRSANAIQFTDKLSELLSIISGNGYDEIILCGDFNLDILNYDNNENTLNVLNSLTSQSLILIITKPSRITNQTATLIDNNYIYKHTKYVCFWYSYLWYIWPSSIIYSETKPVYKKKLSAKRKCEIFSNQWLIH